MTIPRVFKKKPRPKIVRNATWTSCNSSILTMNNCSIFELMELLAISLYSEEVESLIKILMEKQKEQTL